MKNPTIFKVVLPDYFTVKGSVQDADLFFSECGETDYSTFGFIADEPVKKLSNGYQITFAHEEKVIPKPAYAKALNKAALELEQKQGGELSKGQLLELKETVWNDLVKKALSKIATFTAYYHEKSQLLFVDVKKDLAHKAVGTLVHALGSVESNTLHVSGISNSLTTNIQEEIARSADEAEAGNALGFNGFEYADKLHLENSHKEKVKFDGDYTLDHVDELINDGYEVKRVRLRKDGIGFDLTDELNIRSISSNLEVEETLESTKEDIKQAETEALLEVLSANILELVKFFDKQNPELPEAA